MKAMTFPAKSGIKIRPRDNGQADSISYRVDVPARVAGKRILKQYPSLDEAKAFAETQWTGSLTMGRSFIKLSEANQRDAIAALDILRPLNITLTEAARFASKRLRPDGGAKTVREAVAAFLETKRNGGLSARHVGDLESRLGKFRDQFGDVPLAGITTAQLNQWVRGLDVGPQSQRNYRTVTANLFNYGKREGWLPRDFVDHEFMDRPKVRGGDVEVFSPDAAGKLLGAAKPRFLPALAVSLFCGLRSAEVARLDWKDIDQAEGHIVVAAGKAKTASRRIIPISDNLKAWLAPYAKADGPVWRGSTHAMHQAQGKLAMRAGVQWVHNGPRHSFISCRLALIKNPAQVAMECGNSPGVIDRHYKALVTEKTAKAWFSIMPGPVENVVTMPAKTA